MLVQSGPKRQTHWKTKLFLGLGIIVLVIAGINLAKSTQKNRGINEEIKNLEEDILNLEQSNLELNELVKYFNSNAYIEEKARIDLGLKKEGEKVVIITDINKEKPTEGRINTNQLSGKKVALSNPQKWWYYFFK